jgi:hypothetical protein
MSFLHNDAPPHYSREVRQWLPENYPDVGLVAYVKLQFLGLRDHLTGVLLISFCRCTWTSTVDTIQGLWRQAIENTPGIFELFRVSFLRKTDMRFREHRGRFEYLL